MNRKGQTLIIFVMMLPIFLLLAALVIDVGVATNAKLKLSNTTTTVLKTFYEKRFDPDIEEEMKEMFSKNDIPIEHLMITIDSESLEIQNEYAVDSIFGKIVGINEYPLSIQKKMTMVDGKIQMEK